MCLCPLLILEIDGERHSTMLRPLLKAKRTRWQIVLVAAMIVTAALLGLWLGRPGRGGRDETWARIQRDGVLRVGMDASYPPFEDFDDEAGVFVGYDVDLAREIGRRLGVGVEFVNISFDGLYDAVFSGRVDVIVSALPYDPMRTRDVAYSHSYFNAGLALLVRQDTEGIERSQDLSGRTVVVETGSAAHEAARRLRDYGGLDITLLTRRTPEEVIASLLAGEAESAMHDGITSRQLMAGGESVRMVGELISDEPYVIAIPLDSPELLKRMNKVLIALKEERYLDALASTWF